MVAYLIGGNNVPATFTQRVTSRFERLLEKVGGLKRDDYNLEVQIERLTAVRALRPVYVCQLVLESSRYPRVLIRRVNQSIFGAMRTAALGIERVLGEQLWKR